MNKLGFIALRSSFTVQLYIAAFIEQLYKATRKAFKRSFTELPSKSSLNGSALQSSLFGADFQMFFTEQPSERSLYRAIFTE